LIKVRGEAAPLKLPRPSFINIQYIRNFVKIIKKNKTIFLARMIYNNNRRTK